MIIKSNRCSLILTLCLLQFWLLSNSFASGFAIIEMNASGLGNAYAGGAAIADDASTVYFNPAGMALVSDEALIASHFIRPKSKSNGDDSTVSSKVGGGPLNGDDQDGGRDAFVPNFYYIQAISPKVNAGIGVNAPFGLATKYDDDWRGRYFAVESDLKTLNFNPSVSYKATETISLGFGVSLQMMDIVLSNAIDFASLVGLPAQSADGFAYLEADNNDDLSYGWNTGMMIQFSPQTRMGLAYRSEIDHDVEGKADFTVPGEAAAVLANGLFQDVDLTSSVTFPSSFSISGFHQFSSKLTMISDLTWTDWSVFEELRIKYDNNQPDSVTTFNWDDTYRFAFGLNYQYSSRYLIRGGLAYDESPISSAQYRTPRLPGSDRTWLSIGLGINLSKEFIIDIGYSHLFMDDAPIDHEFESSVPTLSSTFSGSYDNSVDILSAQLRWTL